MRSKQTLLFTGQRGVAMLMVIGTITILSALMLNFSYETNINKIKEENIEDRTKAKLMAETGLQFAMARLKLYQGIFNYVQENENLKDFAKQNVLNSIWNFPFIYPLPKNPKMTKIQKDAVDKFLKESVLEGEMNLNIANISNKINLNLLAFSLFTEESDEENKPSLDDINEFSVSAQLFKFLEDNIRRRSEEDPLFEAEFLGIDIQQLINAITYYISDPETYEDRSNVSGLFDDVDLTPKAARFNSFDEIYLIPGWKDKLVNLIKDDFNAQTTMMIDLNKITDKTLRLLIPNLTKEDIEDFFKYRDDPEDPHPLNSLQEFKNYVVNTGNLMSEEDFTNRFDKFKQFGLEIGTTPTLFEVNIIGKYQRATYTLQAIVSLPVRPEKRVVESNNTANNNNPEDNPEDDPEDQENRTESDSPTPESPQEEEETLAKKLLLSPRIIEILVK